MRVVKIDNKKYVIDESYNGFNIYQEVCPSGYTCYQSYLISNDKIMLQIESYNHLCKEEILDMIDTYNETKKFGVKAINEGNYYAMHSSGKYI